MKVTARLERAGDGSWTASMMEGDAIVLGTGESREAALNDLRGGLELLVESLKAEGKTLPQASSEYVVLEIAA
jgi:predicted RNase H-like HicB family nuclease